MQVFNAFQLKSFWLVLVLFMSLVVSETLSAVIVGGKPARPKEFPHMARLGNRNAADNKIDWFCGGTLISNRLVLTAAHCLYSESGAVNIVRLGELDFASDRDDADPEDFGVSSSIEHPDYKYPNLYNDIGLIKLNRAVNINLYKQPACLPSNDGSSYPSFQAIGWGHTRFAGHESTKLKKVWLDAYEENCPKAGDIDELPNGYNASTQLCIGSSEHRDTCNGDSGGPILTFHSGNPCKYDVMGITSIGIGCDTPDSPSLYTRVYFYLGWIRQELAKVK